VIRIRPRSAGTLVAVALAAVSCHTERVLDDKVWDRYAKLAAASPGGFAITSLLRPPQGIEMRSEAVWLERAKQARSWGPIGLHTHFGGPVKARPVAGGAPSPAEQVRAETAWLRQRGIATELFCGGGWYIDGDMASVLAELGYADCTAIPAAHTYMTEDLIRAELAQPATLRAPDGSALPEVPTTHSLGMLARALATRRLPPVVHVMFHDYDLLDRKRRLAIPVLLSALARVRRPVDLDYLAREARKAPGPDWTEVARGSALRTARSTEQWPFYGRSRAADGSAEPVTEDS
jgi:hypothetical protein